MSYDSWRRGDDDFADMYYGDEGMDSHECDECMQYERKRVSVAEDLLNLCYLLWSKEELDVEDIEFIISRMAKDLDVFKEFKKDYEGPPNLQRECKIIELKKMCEVN